MYDTVVPPLSRSLGALSSILTKAEAHCEARKIDPSSLLTFRLFPDMLHFTKQVQLSCDFAARAAARLTGAEVPSYPDTEITFAALRQRIEKVQAALAALTPQDFEGAPSRQITLQMRSGEMSFVGLQFFTQFSLPQFYFHVTTAYNILRHNGVEIGKLDYMGAA